MECGSQSPFRRSPEARDGDHTPLSVSDRLRLRLACRPFLCDGELAALAEMVSRNQSAGLVAMLRLCRLCWGACNLLAIDNGKLHYYECPHCKGLGCTPDTGETRR